MSIFLIILPGPDTAIATKNTLTDGKPGGFKTILGTCFAILIHTLAAVIGLSAIIVKSALLFTIVKYIGALYLIYIGLKALYSLKKKTEPPNNSETKTQVQTVQSSFFRQGFFTNILNPKVAFFFLTFFPQFLATNNQTILPFLIMGMTYTILTAIWYSLYVYFINLISRFMRRPSTQNVIQGLTGVILIGFGLRLAFENN